MAGRSVIHDPQRHNNMLYCPETHVVHDPLACGEHWHSTTEPPNKVLHTLEITFVGKLIPTNRVLPPRPHQDEPHVKHCPYHVFQVRSPKTMYCAAGASGAFPNTFGAHGFVSVSLVTCFGRQCGQIFRTSHAKCIQLPGLVE